MWKLRGGIVNHPKARDLHFIETYIGESEACTGTDIKDKLKCYDLDVHTMKTLENSISPLCDFREFEVEKQDYGRHGTCTTGNLKENSRFQTVLGRNL